jgi:hypothetical protein
MRTDLHIHTTASDSRWTPEEVVAGVLAEGIDLFAVADHDTVAGVVPAESAMQETALGFLRGVEVSASDEGRLLHILAYGIDLTHAGLLALLEENTRKMEETDDADVRQLIDLGYPIDYDEYLTYDYDRRRGGFRSLNYLIDKGLCTGPQDFFKTLRAQLDHPWPDFIHPAQVVETIRGAGGVPILAHPGASFRRYGGVTEENLASLLAYGIAGLECYSQYHDEATTEACVTWCDRQGLLITGGSDYHGGFVGRQLGVPDVDSTLLRLGALEEAIVWGSAVLSEPEG